MKYTEIIIGFFLGLAGSFLFEAIKYYISPVSFRKVGLSIARPDLLLSSLPWREEGRAATTIRNLFKSWEKKDETAYKQCWSPSAIRVTGDRNSLPENLGQIVDTFKSSCSIYSQIKVKSLFINGISIEKNSCTAYVWYQFFLHRKADGLPLIEEADEVYRLEKIGNTWKIAANFDHFKSVTK